MNPNDITYKINGAVFEVNRELGPGFLEKVYENALLIELKERGLKAKNQVPIKVEYKGKIVGEYYADIVVENQIIIELKAVESLQKIHDAQLLNYLVSDRKAANCVCGNDIRSSHRIEVYHNFLAKAIAHLDKF